jgi:hypothetical protein
MESPRWQGVEKRAARPSAAVAVRYLRAFASVTVAPSKRRRAPHRGAVFPLRSFPVTTVAYGDNAGVLIT